jgi:hypothetical protein
MTPSDDGSASKPLRHWQEPTLARHQSLMAVTRAPLSPEMIEVAMTASMVMMQIGGSQGFFVAPGFQPDPNDPNAPPTAGYSGW